MTKRTRLTILFVCVICFLVVAPILVAYSMGYRFDVENMKITATGGIYVKTYPVADSVIVDSKIINKPGMFSNWVFVQSLLPNNHTVLVKKSEYYDYSKILSVQENQVTKLENVLLVKKNMQFQLTDATTQSPFVKQDRYIIKNSDLYYSSSPENSTLTVLQKTTPLLKKIAAFSLQNNSIIWIKTDGLLYKSDLTDLTAQPVKMSLTPIKITKAGVYKILTDSRNIFLDNNSSLLVLSSKTNDFENFYSPVTDAKISPNGENIIYCNDNNVFISAISATPALKNTLYKSSEKIKNCQWVNNDNIIFTAGDKILISETDYRGNINAVTLPTAITVPAVKKTETATSATAIKQPVELPATVINIKNPEIYFDQQQGRLYVLTGKNMIVSEKITQ